MTEEITDPVRLRAQQHALDLARDRAYRVRLIELGLLIPRGGDTETPPRALTVVRDPSVGPRRPRRR